MSVAPSTVMQELPQAIELAEIKSCGDLRHSAEVALSKRTYGNADKSIDQVGHMWVSASSTQSPLIGSSTSTIKATTLETNRYKFNITHM